MSEPVPPVAAGLGPPPPPPPPEGAAPAAVLGGAPPGAAAGSSVPEAAVAAAAVAAPSALAAAGGGSQPAPPAAAASPATPAAVPADAASWAATWRKLLTVAWLSIGLAFTLEVLLLVVAGYHDRMGTTPGPFVADLAQKVSWGLIACLGLAIGSTVAKARPAAMGLLGLVAAPLGFHVARAAHKGVGQALGLTGAAAALPLLLLTVLKGVEYGLLGAVIGYVAERRGGRLGAYLGTGVAFGLLFGAAVLMVLAQASPQQVDTYFLLSRGINEVLFPVGCSLVLYAGEAMSRRLAG
jgi:hypothetical protein